MIQAESEVQPTGIESLDVEFLLADGSRRSMSFVRRPLGLDFNKATPIVIQRIHPGAHANELGVQPGWQVVGLNGEDVSKMGFDYSYQILRRSAEALPMESAESTSEVHGMPRMPSR